MIHPILKHGDLIIPAYRLWVGEQNCSHCGRAPRSECHHFPSRGASGYTFDLRIAPLCLECHKRAGGETVWFGNARLAPIDAEKQTMYVALTWQRFIERAPMQTVDLVMAEVRRWRQDRGEAVAW